MVGIYFLNTTLESHSLNDNETNDELGMQIPRSFLAVSARNTIIAVTSIFISICSGVLILMTRLKNPIKIILLNLLICDLTVVVSTLVQSVFAGNGDTICLIAVFFLTNGVVQCHGAIAIISMNNFLAIFYPYQYRFMMSTRKAAISVVLAWILFSSCSVMTLASKTESQFPTCTPLAIATRSGIVVVAFILLILDLSIITMNTLLCIKLRQRDHLSISRVAPYTPRTLNLNLNEDNSNSRNNNRSFGSNRRKFLMFRNREDNTTARDHVNKTVYNIRNTIPHGPDGSRCVEPHENVISDIGFNERGDHIINAVCNFESSTSFSSRGATRCRFADSMNSRIPPWNHEISYFNCHPNSNENEEQQHNISNEHIQNQPINASILYTRSSPCADSAGTTISENSQGDIFTIQLNPPTTQKSITDTISTNVNLASSSPHLLKPSATTSSQSTPAPATPSPPPPTCPAPFQTRTHQIGVSSTSNGISTTTTNTNPSTIRTRATARTTITTTPTPTNLTNVNSSRSASSIRFRKLSYAMIIIALWCSILNIPFISFMFYIAIGAEDRFKVNYGHFGLVATTSLSIDILGDPVIYAWRFINWKVISRRLWSICQHRR